MPLLRSARKRLRAWMAPPPAEQGELVRLAELRNLGCKALERRSRAAAQAVYLGDNTVLCRVLGRFKLFVRADDDGFGAHVMLDGVWESGLTAFMASRIHEGMAVVDVGANHGYYTLLFASLVGERGRVAALEPHPVTAGLLRRSVLLNGFQPQTQIIQQAAGDVDGRKVLFGAPAHEFKNARILPANADWADGQHRVRIARLDTLLSNWPRVDFLKVDVEGAEEAAVRGMMGVLQRDKPGLLLEFNAGRCVNPGALLDDLHGVYGRFVSVDPEGQTLDVDRDALLELSRQEDWLLYFEPSAGLSDRASAT